MQSTYKRRLDGVYDQEGNRLLDYDLTLGYLTDQTKTIHHDAIEGAEEQGHWETVAEYPNGGRDVAWVVDVPGVEAVEAWDEEVVYSAYIPYTQEELDENWVPPEPEPDTGERLKALEDTLAAYEAAYREGVQSA